MNTFIQWFKQLTGSEPFPYQTRLATAANLRIILNVTTGVEKTAAAVLWPVLCCG